jgi:hypothetical protein
MSMTVEPSMEDPQPRRSKRVDIPPERRGELRDSYRKVRRLILGEPSTTTAESDAEDG